MVAKTQEKVETDDGGAIAMRLSLAVIAVNLKQRHVCCNFAQIRCQPACMRACQRWPAFIALIHIDRTLISNVFCTRPSFPTKIYLSDKLVRHLSHLASDVSDADITDIRI